MQHAVKEIIQKAKFAQGILESKTETQINELLFTIAANVLDHSEDLAKLNVEESGIGVTSDKKVKIEFVGKVVPQFMCPKKGVGVLRTDHETGITEIACPVGVVFALIPVTNPVSTLLFKTLISLKTRNSIIFSVHPRTTKTAARTGAIVHEALDLLRFPRDLVYVIENSDDLDLVREFMQNEEISLILATGGPGVVRAAYQSGNPAIGVGAGNAPVMVCDDADIKTVARTIVNGKSFDNGIICGSENNIVVTQQNAEELVTQLILDDAAVLKPREVELVTKTVFKPEGGIKAEFIGKSAQHIASHAGIHRDYKIKLLVLPVPVTVDLSTPLVREKLAPIVSLLAVSTESAGFDICRGILQQFGTGHTAIIHSNDEKKIEEFSLLVPASRILVNTPGSQGCIGMGNNLAPSFTLGCGTWGGGSTTDNINFKHLLNIKRIARPKMNNE